MQTQERAHCARSVFPFIKKKKNMKLTIIVAVVQHFVTSNELFSFFLVTISKSGVIKMEVLYILITYDKFSFKHCQGLGLSHLSAASIRVCHLSAASLSLSGE